MLSLIVCTRNRPAMIADCLEGISRMRGDFEVIVVDSASEPSVRETVQQFARRIPRLRYIYEPVAGLSRARNRGVAAAREPLVAFLDDDSVPEPGWAQAIAAAFADPDVVCVGGACLPNFEVRRPRWLSSRLLPFVGCTTFDERVRVRSRWQYPFGGNVCYRRDALRPMPVFDEHLGRSGDDSLLSGEETPVIETLVRSGKTVLLEPAARMHHFVSAERCQPSYFRRRLWWTGVSRSRTGSQLRLMLRLTVAVPIRAGLYLLTRDRVFLYRLAESAGYWTGLVQRVAGTVR